MKELFLGQYNCNMKEDKIVPVYLGKKQIGRIKIHYDEKDKSLWGKMEKNLGAFSMEDALYKLEPSSLTICEGSIEDIRSFQVQKLNELHYSTVFRAKEFM